MKVFLCPPAELTVKSMNLEYDKKMQRPQAGLEDIPAKVDRLLSSAIEQRASDIHIEPGRESWAVRCRIDGLLQTRATVDPLEGRAIVTRLMVMAQLLTYRQDIPQEGRLRFSLPTGGEAVEMRVSIIPTMHGLRAAVRLPAELIQPKTLEELGLSQPILDGLYRFAAAEAGMLLVTGPAGSGKTTTIYALLEHIVATESGLSVIALEDPIERDLPGVTQIEVRPHGELTYERALRSILRQDPQVLMLGEIRDAATASLAVQAALSGHRLVATLHAAGAGGTIARLLEMGIEPYQLSSALWGVLSQRLLRRAGADGGYAGRVPVAELAIMDDALRKALLDRADAESLQRIVEQQAQFVPMRQAADALVQQGLSRAEEMERVLGHVKK